MKPQFVAEKDCHGNEEGELQGTDDDDLFSGSFVYHSFRSGFLDLVSIIYFIFILVLFNLFWFCLSNPVYVCIVMEETGIYTP